MTRHSADVYEFGPFRLEPSERRLLRGGQEVPLPPKAFDVLVALVSRAGRLEVYAARFPGFTEKRQLSIAGGVQPRWRGDGRELFYLTPDGTMMAVPFNPDGTTSTGAARALFKTSLNPPSFQQSEFDVSADGERFLILEPASTRPQVFTFLLNWMEGPTR